jgi:hypothetical protein
VTLCVTDGWGAREQDGFESLMREEFPLLAEDASLLEGLFSALGAAWRQRLCLLPTPPSPPHRQPSRALFVTSAIATRCCDRGVALRVCQRERAARRADHFGQRCPPRARLRDHISRA